MDTLSFKTVSAKKETMQHDWYVIDATNKTVGRLSSQVAAILRGKNKAIFTPHVDCGDYVVIINAEKVVFTGKKTDQKEYVTHSHYPGGQKLTTPRQFLAKFPERILENAIKGMLPKNKLGRQMYSKLFVYAGAEHPHAAQQPKPLEL